MVNIAKTNHGWPKSLSYYGDKEPYVCKAYFFFDRFSVRAYFRGIELQMHELLGKKYWPINGTVPTDFWEQIKKTKARFQSGNQ